MAAALGNPRNSAARRDNMRRLWHLDWQAPQGSYTLMARATNASGQVQPLEQEWNPSGYLWNACNRVNVEVTNKEASNTPAEPHTAAHPPGYQAACLTCHDEGMMLQQRLTPAQWDREINKMTGW